VEHRARAGRELSSAQEVVMTGRKPRGWPLVVIALPAAVSIWSGWVGLGGLCGFGIVHPLPGIASGLQINTAITLPIGVEAYGAYALRAWLAPAGSAAVRTFARRSALGALALGMAGQVIFHLLSAAHAPRAPWPVVVLVFCMPVVTLGFGAALTHLLRGSENEPAATITEPSAEPLAPGSAQPAQPVPADRESAARAWYAATVAVGHPASANQLRTRFELSRSQAAKVCQAEPAAFNGQSNGQPVTPPL
jgi:hypothetical protein